MHILIDTNVLWKTHEDFGHPDFRKLLHYSQQGVVKLYVSQITWEERRTQLLGEIIDNRNKINSHFNKLKRQYSTGVLLQGLPEPFINIWDDEIIDTNSKQMMKNFAEEKGIEVIPYAPDHGERAWERYFNVESPFNSDQKREDRRKDIPDSWIFEAAIDLKEKHELLFSICEDGRLSKALKDICVRVFSDVTEVLEHVEKQSLSTQESPSSPQELTEEGSDLTSNKLDEHLETASESFKGLDKVVLGYVAYLEVIPKFELFDMLEKSERHIPEAITMNVASRLVINGLIDDTGNNYIAHKTEINKLAADSVESEIIKFIGDN